MVIGPSSIPFKEYTVNAGGFTVTCREAGQGLPAVFVETFRWGNEELLDELGKRFHLFVLNFEDAVVEGMEEIRYEIVAAKQEGAEVALREFARTLAGDTYNLVGAYQGANLALRTVLQTPSNPEPVESLVLISPTAIRSAPDLHTLNWTGADQATGVWSGPPGLSERMFAHPDRHLNLGSWGNNPGLVNGFLPKQSDVALEERLQEVSCPTLAVFGTKDRLIEREAPSTYRANIPNCHVSLVYDAGHLALTERPEAVARAVIDFVENRETFVVNRQSSVINP